VSSQFLTALLMALPLVAQHRAIDIEVEGELISKPYIDITLRLLARFGIAIERRQGWQRFVIPAGSRYISPGRIHIEGDASSASYFIGLGAIAAPDSAKPIRIEGLGLDSIQGDIRFIDAASAMGAKIDAGPNWLEIHRGAWPLRAIDLDCNAIPDAAMTLATMALYAEGVTRLRNIASWRVKETDRIAAMACELRKLGATVQEGEDFIAITPPSVPQWRAATIHTYDDHRIAMCFSLAAFNPLASSVDNAKHPCVPVRILDPKCVGKTFPDYFETLFSVSHAPPSAIPVITVDGPTASGKGTLASALAKRLGYHHLDSGVLYRAAALTAMRADVDPSNGPAIAALACEMPLRFVEQRIWLAAEDVTDVLRSESIGNLASVVSAHPEVRAALHDLQLRFRRLPGLVADGRDMGTMIFPDADLKVFLTASAETRAQRRYLQLLSKAITVNMPDLLADLRARDSRDTQRNAAPLKPSSDAHLLDNSMQSVEESVAQVLAWWQQHCEVQRQRNSAA
jgi:3-phosphoshikimate 1-carboxyvinyltransferase